MTGTEASPTKKLFNIIVIDPELCCGLLDSGRFESESGARWDPLTPNKHSNGASEDPTPTRALHVAEKASSILFLERTSPSARPSIRIW